MLEIGHLRFEALSTPGHTRMEFHFMGQVVCSRVILFFAGRSAGQAQQKRHNVRLRASANISLPCRRRPWYFLPMAQ
jgi:hypothetical protein